jgi:cyclin C
MLKRASCRSACRSSSAEDIETGDARNHADPSRFLLNDTYRTDVHLLYPPHIVALAALYIGFTLSSMTPATRSRSTSTQQSFAMTPTEINAALSLPPPPTIPAEFMASFQVNFPLLMACVQDIIVLYPIWEKFEPSVVKSRTIEDVKNPPKTAQVKFGPEDAEVLVGKMIEERMKDLAAADAKEQLAGKKRQR